MRSARSAEPADGAASIDEAVLCCAGPQGPLIGILTCPRSHARARVLVVADANETRVGPHRLLVELARLLAGRGLSSLRFDVPGQGDSPGTLLAPEHWPADIAAAAVSLREATGKQGPFWILGHGAGAAAAVLALPELRERGCEPDGFLLLAPELRLAVPDEAGNSPVADRPAATGVRPPASTWRTRLLEWLHLPARRKPAIADARSRAGFADIPPAPANTLSALEDYRGKVLVVIPGRERNAEDLEAELARNQRLARRLARRKAVLRIAGADHAVPDSLQRESIARFLAEHA